MADESELIKTLIWSNEEYSLAQFITEYPLPQLVRVVDGYYSTNEDTCLGAYQVLALHDVHSTPKVLGNDHFGKPVAIPLDCTTKALVCPLKSKFVTDCSVQALKSVYPKIEYVRVESTKEGESNDDQSVRVNDLLKITKLDKKTKLVHFQNIDTKQQVSLDYSHPALFTPLLDSRKYSLAEIKQIYGFPARVRFLNEGGGDVRRKANAGRGSPSTVSNLGEVVLREEKTETAVIATTIGGKLEEKLCIGLPKELPVNFVVAEGFLLGGGSYEEVVRTLHSNIKVTNLTDFDQINVHQHLNAVRKYAFTNADHFTAGPDSRSVPHSKRRLPKLSTKRTEVLPTVPSPPPHTIASDRRSTNLSKDSCNVGSSGLSEDSNNVDDSEYTYVQFSVEKHPAPPPSRDNNGQKAPPNSENSPSTEREVIYIYIYIFGIYTRCQ